MKLSKIMSIAAILAGIVIGSGSARAEDPTPNQDKKVIRVNQPANGQPPVTVMVPIGGTLQIAIAGESGQSAPPVAADKAATAATNASVRVEIGPGTSAFRFAVYSKLMMLGESYNGVGGLRFGHTFRSVWSVEAEVEIGGGSCRGTVLGLGGAVKRRFGDYISVGFGPHADWCVNLRENPMTGANLEEWRANRFIGGQASLEGHLPKGFLLEGSFAPGYLGTPQVGDIAYQRGLQVGVAIGHTWD